MKKIILSFLSLYLAFFALPVFAQDYSESIEKFNVVIQIQEDSSILVTESILYDFGDNERRGIIRDIPVMYELEGGDLTTELEVIDVTDQNGESRPYVVEGYYYKSIRIGDPDVYITGKHWYVISYTVENVINGFFDHDELYWNVTGDEWSVPIYLASATITLPEGNVGTQDAICFTGYRGSQEMNCSAATNTHQFFIKSSDTLSPYEGLTTAVKFDKGIVKVPTTVNVTTSEFDGDIYIDGEFMAYAPGTIRLQPGVYELEVKKYRFYTFSEEIILMEGQSTEVYAELEKTKLWIFIQYYLPFIIFGIGLIAIWAFFNKYGKEPPGRGTIIAEYEAPDGLTPGEIGVIVDQRANMRDISASILYFATEGYIKIKREAKKRKFWWGEDIDYTLIKKKDFEEGETFEKFLFDKIFGSKDEVKLSDLENTFYTHLPKLKEKMYRAVISKKYFVKSPEKVRSLYLGIGIAILVAANFVGMMAFAGTESSIYLFLWPWWGAIMIILSFFMPKRTKKGAVAYEKILGLKDFITVTAKERIKQMHSPKNFQELFESLLPYAISLEVEKDWAKQFEGLYDIKPDWYEGDDITKFNTMNFVNSLASMNKVANSAMASKPGGSYSSGGFSSGSSGWSGGSGFSGGGFSGGGFGGGGGSSW